MNFPENNKKYSWNDLKEIAVIADRSYTFFDNTADTIKFFDCIEDNVNIKCLISEDDNKQSIDLTVLPDDVGEFSKQVKYIKCKDTNAECFIFTYYNSLIISFVGSNSLTDWGYDFTLSKERIFLNGKFCDIHRGFYEQYYSIKENISILCKGYCNNNSNPHVLIIGHSLGVIGQLCGFDIKQISNDISIDFVSFGAPCVGNNDFVLLADKIFDNNIRFVNDEDIVPVFLRLFGYSHSGNIIRFEDNAIILYESNSIWNDIKNVVSDVIKNFFPFFGTNILLNHLMKDYIYRIDNCIKKNSNLITE